jgi:hypothetical protein
LSNPSAVRLHRVAINKRSNATTANSKGFDNGGSGTSNDYTYDVNDFRVNDFEKVIYEETERSSMITDLNKGISEIKYNYLNLPTEISWTSTKKINYLYNAAGEKVEKKVTNGSTIQTTDYRDGFQYYNGVLQFFPHAEGYVKNTVVSGQNTYDYVYNYTDHLGNISGILYERSK